MFIKGKKVLYDREDEDLVSQFSWYLNKGYVETKKRGRTLLLHRLVTGLYDEENRSKAKDLVVDHVNGDKLDNRKENLRVVSVQQNAMNRKRSVGVHLTPTGKWIAVTTLNGKTYHLGTYGSRGEAKEVYDKMMEMRNSVYLPE